MSENRFWLWGLLVVSIGAALWYRSQILPATADDQPQTTRVVFITGGDNDFWQLAAKGAKAAALEHNAKLKTEMVSREGGLEEQTQILLGLNEDEIDGCAVSPLDAQGQTLLINRLARKMNVVTYDSDAPISERQYYIGTSNYLAGKISHELVREAIPEGGKIAVFLSNITKNNMLERKSGYEESEKKLQSDNPPQDASAPVWQTVAYLTDEGDTAKSQANITKALENHDDLACLVGMNAYQGPLLLEALTKAGKIGEIKLVVFDELDDTLEGIETGSIYATVAQDPYKYGYEAVRMLTLLHNGKSRELPIVGGGAINVNCQAIRKADVEAFRKRLKDRLEESK
ncbi:substrate-binding domain-containing protein [Bythopirellula goksoeyrii]|uniref:D-allose-binding periplasmic protein n=1 Tax=Bythopirellula goksoeyrii TaxID=1400387 RepID=A0A5B9QEX9_9BACT|nr:substrate-binding domain-containing protein [Bythopirellula goksoeyrii]QEG36439.1 D-allose-binding periplasmic protein precursor [Bythopirellula goksoeyrii]